VGLGYENHHQGGKIPTKMSNLPGNTIKYPVKYSNNPEIQQPE
jgi:hypothetical protein